MVGMVGMGRIVVGDSGEWRGDRQILAGNPFQLTKLKLK